LLTFRRGSIRHARFAPDGQTVIYGATWDGRPVEVFSTRAESTESRSLALYDTEILAISPAGEMAISLRRRPEMGFAFTGTLARTSLAGGAPRELSENVEEADFSPDGARLAIVRRVNERHRLELPSRKLLYETRGWLSHPRISPRGDLVAFIDRSLFADDGGKVAVVDGSGAKRTLTGEWNSIMGIAWSRSGDEIWFAADEVGQARALRAVSLQGRQRLLLRVPGSLTLHDISRDGKILVTRDDIRFETEVLATGEKNLRNLTWLDYTVVTGISPDGKRILFCETGIGGGPRFSTYLRKIDGSAPVRLGDGSSGGLSPDGKWAISFPNEEPQQIVLLPTGAGEPRALTHGRLDHREAHWFPDGKRILSWAREPGRLARHYVVSVADGASRPVTPEGLRWVGVVSPDGKLLAAVDASGHPTLYPIEGGDPRAIRGAVRSELPIAWGADGRTLYLFVPSLPGLVHRIDLATGQKRLWRELMPTDPAGVKGIGQFTLSADEKTYAYGYMRFLSALYLIEGLK
jgi:Tol biopolymer transport system component